MLDFVQVQKRDQAWEKPVLVAIKESHRNLGLRVKATPKP